ncbi:GNAT family N-acetyltransferase [Chitinolyticbacter meiyuanensis]|uniref:GNAT family N-acetyltransferase n=1 Tax=Chitinolyticbacter meiyuanensis TaxID=682798 RepID=UPI0011E58E5C|nr:GNAT family N-acetyltransferase [Chitinolyticbacter meiyuanensis]
MAETRIALLEALTMSAWPALSTEVFDGWALRFADGYTKRANSVVPLYDGALPDDAKRAYVERRYRAAGLPAVFKLTVENAALDEQLAALGYQQVDVSSVQTLALEQRYEQDPEVTLWRKPDPAWFDAFAAMGVLTPGQRITAQRMLAGYACETAFAALHHEGRAVACGFAVRQWDSVVLFDIVTEPASRRSGYGRRLVHSLLAWGQETGATQGLLQVVADNAPAVALYASLGFAEQYRYWYRRQPA